MSVVVQATIENTGATNCRAIFRNPRGQQNYYAFYVTTTGEITFERSTDGSSWTNPTTVENLSTGVIPCVDIAIFEDAGNSQLVVHYVRSDSDTTDNAACIYKRGLIADAGATISWGANSQIDAGGNNSEAFKASVCLDANNRLVVAFTKVTAAKGNAWADIAVVGSSQAGTSIPDAPTWSSLTRVPDFDPSVGADTNDAGKGGAHATVQAWNSADSQDGCVFAVGGRTGTTGDSYDVGCKDFTFNGTTFTWDTTRMALTAVTYREITGLIDTNSTRRAHMLVRLVTTNSTLTSYSRQVASAWGTVATVVTITGGSVGAMTAAIDRSPATDDIYAFYQTSADADIDYHSAASNADQLSWSGATQLEAVGANVTFLASHRWDLLSSFHLLWIQENGANHDVRYLEEALAGIQSGAFSADGDGDITAEGASDVAGNASSAGAGALTGDGASDIAGEFSADGAGDLTAVGTGLADGAFSADGTGVLTAEGTSLTTVSGALDAQGAGALTGEGASDVAGNVSSDGVAALTAIGASDVAGAVSSDGVATLTIQGSSIAEAAWSADGVGSLTVVGTQATGIEEGAFGAVGVSTVTLEGAATAVAAILAAGEAALTVQGASDAAANFSSDGQGDLTAEGTAVASGALSSDGAATMTVVGASLAISDGAVSMDGTAGVTLEGASDVVAALSAIGAATLTMEAASDVAGAFVSDGAGDMTMVGFAVGAPAEEEEPAPVSRDEGGGLGRPSSYRRYRRAELEQEDEEIMAIIHMLAPEIMKHYENRTLH